jgi:predicted ester cyclase
MGYVVVYDTVPSDPRHKDGSIPLHTARVLSGYEKEQHVHRREQGPSAPGASIEDLIAERDKVVAHWRAHATHLGEYMGIPPTSNRVNFTGISIYIA